MLWQLIIKSFGTNIQNVFLYDNILADTLIGLKSASIDQVKTSTMRDQSLANELFSCSVVRSTKECLSLYILILQR